MTLTVRTPAVDDLDQVVAALADCQTDVGPPQLHPGDIGWNGTGGPEAAARSLRVWEHDGEPVAIGLVEDEGVIRLGVHPSVADDEQVARSIADDLSGSGALGPGFPTAEVRYGVALQRNLRERGWTRGDAWACFTLDLADAIPPQEVRVDTVDATSRPDDALVASIVATHRAAWERSTFSVEKFHAMRQGPAFRHARFLVLHDDDGPVATAAVWSAGSRRPGIIEPLGVAADRRGRGHGRAIVTACAHALRDLGASVMRVATPVTQIPAVPLYAATMRRLPDDRDFVRPTSTP